MIQKDTIKHMKGGTIAALFAVAVGYALLWLGLHTIPTILVVSGWVAGLSVEGTQYEDNVQAGHHVHDVEFRDAFATALPAMVVAAVVELIIRGVI